MSPYLNDGPAASEGVLGAVLDRHERPTALQVLSENIPDTLKQRHAWVCWSYVLRDGRWTKMPFQPNRLAASSTNPATWSSFDVVMRAYKRGGFDGIGLALDGKPDAAGLVLAGVDLDHVRDTPERLAHALRIVADFGSYAEWSPSGEGLRIFGLAKPLPKGVVSRDGVELYTSGRYLTVTGRLFRGIA